MNPYPAGRVPSPGAKVDIGADAGSGDPTCKGADIGVVGRVPSPGAKTDTGADAGSGDPAYKGADTGVVGRVPSPGAKTDTGADAGSGDPACKGADTGVVGRVPSPGVPSDPSREPDEPARRLRRLHRVWPDGDGNISYLLTLCVDGRARVLDNETTFERLVEFLLDSPGRYRWFPRRFVVMPDHVHVIAGQGHEAVRLSQWIKALKAVMGGLRRRESGAGPAVGTGKRIEEQQGTEAGSGVVGRVPSPGAKTDIGADAGSGDPAYKGADIGVVGRVPSPGAKADIGADAGSGDPAYKGADTGVVGRVPPPGEHEFIRLKRSWRWQEGFHDHKFRTPESEQRKWEYVCLNPVRYGLVERPEQWPFGGEVFYDDSSGPRLIRGTPPLLETGILVNEDGSVTSPGEGTRLTDDCVSAPGEGTRPTGKGL